MHHARDPIPSCGGGVANLHSTVYAQNPESALPGGRACEKEAGRRILYGGGVLVEVLSVGNSVRLDSTSLLGHG